MKNLENVELFLLDMDGTIYLEGELIDGAKEKIEEIKAKGKKICFLTNNSSVSAKDYIVKLGKLGIMIDENEIYTSGQATAEYLNDLYNCSRVYLVGTDKLKSEFVSYGINLVDDNPDIVVLGYDTTLTYEKLVKLTSFIKLGSKFIATHPDINCPAKDVYAPDVGSFLKLIEASTGLLPEVICGKPYKLMGERIMKRFGLESDQIAMVGDRLVTDMKFAENSGFFSILVLSGETTMDMARCFDGKIDLILDGLKCLQI